MQQLKPNSQAKMDKIKDDNLKEREAIREEIFHTKPCVRTATDKCAEGAKRAVNPERECVR